MSENLLSDLLRRAYADPSQVLLQRPLAPTTDASAPTGIPDEVAWIDVTVEEFLADVRAVAGGLHTHGVCAGDRVALLSHTTYEWTLLDYAIWYVGAVSVPLFPTAGADAIRAIVQDAQPSLALTDTAVHTAAINDASPELPVIGLDDGGLAELRATPALFPPLVDGDQPATIIYTSGTTGAPRGCVLSHRALAAAAVGLCDALPEVLHPEARTLIVLPLPHVLARGVQLACVHSGAVFAHARGAQHFPEDVAAIRPTFLAGVPRLFERIYTRASQQAAVNGKARAFERATEVAMAYSRAKERGGAGLALRTRHTFVDRGAFAAVRDALGGELKFGICGGAPLGDRLGHFFRGMGVPILEAYVLTETAGTAVVSRPRLHQVGTVGESLPGVETKLADDGEILIRSDQLLDGYWGAPQATAEVLRGGWFHTGDLADPTEQGNLTLAGRKHEVLVTAGGKVIVPTVLEDRIRAHPLIDQVVVVGDGQPFAAALITVDPQGFEAWRSRTGKRADIKDLVSDPDLRGAVKVAIEQANRTVSPSEAVRRFVVLPGRWTVEAGQLTPSRKLRRDVVLRQNRSEIEALFSS